MAQVGATVDAKCRKVRIREPESSKNVRRKQEKQRRLSKTKGREVKVESRASLRDQHCAMEVYIAHLPRCHASGVFIVII